MNTTMMLNKGWTFKQVEKAGSFFKEAADPRGFVPATVPGIAHWDLMKQKKIPDPFFRDNELKIQWIEDKHWLYRMDFDVGQDMLDAKRLMLTFEGLDTFCEIWLNGRKLGERANMFIPHEFDVTGYLQRSRNRILVLFKPPMEEFKRRCPRNYKKVMEDQKAKSPMGYIEPYAAFGRKAAYSFGWDWGFRLAAVGIWKNVTLTAVNHARLNDVDVRQPKVSSRKADLHVAVSAREIFGNKPLTCRLTIRGRGVSLQREEKLRKGTCEFRLSIRNPKLWWPNGYGDQPLYTLTVQILEDGKIVDERVRRVGIRSLELVREKDAIGTSFGFRVNGVPIFCKGSNWIPADSILPRLTDQDYDDLVEGMAAANMNMVRIWGGGGLYENDRFYDKCDECGILIWHDFMFGNGIPPELPEFYREWEEEVIYQLKRLRGRPSIALWCGGNESEGFMFYTCFLRGLVEKYNPDVSYWAQSPSSDSCQFHFLPTEGLANMKLNAQTEGDCHAWGRHSERYGFAEKSNNIARFVSEWGRQSYPCLDSIRAFTAPEDRFPNSAIMAFHSRCGDRVHDSIGMQFMVVSAHFPMTGDLKQFVRLSQITQGEHLAADIDHWRRRTPMTSGTLIWQFNDCWPVVSWSLVDYYHHKKLSYWLVKRAFEPLRLSVMIRNDRFEVWLANDTDRPFEGRLRYGIMTLKGRKIVEQQRRVRAKKYSASKTAAQPLGDIQYDPQDSVVYAEFSAPSGISAEASALFKAPKDVCMRRPFIRRRIVPGNGCYKIELTADTYVKYATLDAGRRRVSWSDNVVDLWPGRKKTITCTPLEESITRQALERSLAITVNW